MNDTLQIACPHCHTLNRAPAQKLVPGVRGKCGQCGDALFEGKPVALDTGHFGQHADKSDLPLLVDFWAAWCGPCRQMAPQFEAAAAKLEPKVRLAKVDTEAEPTLAQRFGIQGIPTIFADFKTTPRRTTPDSRPDSTSPEYGLGSSDCRPITVTMRQSGDSML